MRMGLGIGAEARLLLYGIVILIGTTERQDGILHQDQVLVRGSVSFWILQIELVALCCAGTRRWQNNEGGESWLTTSHFEDKGKLYTAVL